MIQRRTQSETYWREQFRVTEEDISQLYSLLLDEGRPLSPADLARAVIEHHCRQEEALIARELSRGPIYQPKDAYEIGQQVIFPVFDYTVGTVTGTRPGRSPDYGEFTVIRVEFEDGQVREFASQLQGDHKLNLPAGQDLLAQPDLLTPAELYELYGAAVEEALLDALREEEGFVSFGGRWFLRDLLVPIDLGRLNIAEALVEINSRPLPTAEFLPELDLPAEASEELQIFSLNCALQADDRFDNVGDEGRNIWYLRRLTPEPVVSPPDVLKLEIEPYDRKAISEELLLIEREIDDEGSGEEVMGPSRPLYRTTIALTYPHWRSGTLPLTVRTRSLFPRPTDHHLPVVLVDGQSGDKMQGWVVYGDLFVYGLQDWYQRYRLPVGARIKLERTRSPRVIAVNIEPRRLKHLWSRVAVVKDGQLTFQMRKLPIACDYDEPLTISEDDPAAIDELRRQARERGETTLQIMIRIMPELVQLSPQRTVHAKTVYSAVNVLKRTPPGPIFALLSSEPAFRPMGGGYWAFDPALV